MFSHNGRNKCPLVGRFYTNGLGQQQFRTKMLSRAITRRIELERLFRLALCLCEAAAPFACKSRDGYHPLLLPFSLSGEVSPVVRRPRLHCLRNLLPHHRPDDSCPAPAKGAAGPQVFSW